MASALGIMMEMAHICISSAVPPGRRGNCAIHYAHNHDDDGGDGDGAGDGQKGLFWSKTGPLEAGVL